MPENEEAKRELKPRLAVTTAFLEEYYLFSRELKDKLTVFMEKFIEAPRSPGINYERLQGAKDDKVHSVRVDQVYRGIVIAPRKGNVYLLVHVDREEDAYPWAMDRVFVRDDEDREILIIQETFEETLESPAKRSGYGEGLLGAHDDDALLSLNVPKVLLPSVRAIQTVEGYDDLADLLPTELVMGLKWLANGDPLPYVKQQIEKYGQRDDDPTTESS